VIVKLVYCLMIRLNVLAICSVQLVNLTQEVKMTQFANNVEKTVWYVTMSKFVIIVMKDMR